MMTLVIESGLRSLMLAVIVWGGIKLLGVRHVLAQKIAWGLVLLTAFAMPLLMHWQSAHPGAALVVPVKQTRVVTAIEKRVSSLNITPSPSPSGIASVPTASTSTSLTSIDEAVPTISLQPTTRSSATWHASDLVRYIVPSYLTVSAVLLLRLLFGLALAMRIWNRAEPASPILEPRATVRISDRIQSPVTIGSGIVLPANYTEWGRSKLRFVLTHERSHVRQGDFYLQLLASLYAALVWVSPLGWYLKHRLAELGEAISDRAALQEANDHSSYAEVLLEFAAMPRHGFAGVTAGVGMARSSNIQRRIERILNERIFRSAFLSGRRHAVIAALLVPCGLVLATSLLRVQAAEAVKARAVAVLKADIDQQAKPSTLLPPATIAPLNTKPEPAVLAAIAQNPSAPHVVLAEDAENDAPDVEDTQNQPAQIQGWSDSDDGNSFAVVDGDKNSTTSVHAHTYFSGSSDDYGELDRVRAKVHGSFLWFEHDGKSYVVSDPAMVAKIKALYAPQEELGRKQAELGKQQEELGRLQEEAGKRMEEVKVQVPDISKEIAELQRSIQNMPSQATQENLSELESKLGEMQSKLGQAQSQAGVKMGVFGAQQGELGRKQGELGRQQGELGREQARIAREATQQVRSMIEQALRDGQATPVE
jgi:beta-lactamase regulating signal transducer with metallopeptidase domain